MNTIGFKQSRKSLADYIGWRRSRSQPALLNINRYKRLDKCSVLDIGCGYGSLMANLLEYGAKVTGVETDSRKIRVARRFLQPHTNYQIIKVVNCLLPFPAGKFDVVFLFDVIEHVDSPQITLKECYRVLKPGGLLYVEFTPYYSLSGHHLYDYTKLPVHLYTSESSIKNLVFTKKVSSFITPQEYWSQFKSLNKLTIDNFIKLASTFQKLRQKYIIKLPEIFEVSLPLYVLPGRLKDFFTMSFEGIYRK